MGYVTGFSYHVAVTTHHATQGHGASARGWNLTHLKAPTRVRVRGKLNRVGVIKRLSGPRSRGLFQLCFRFRHWRILHQADIL